MEPLFIDRFNWKGKPVTEEYFLAQDEETNYPFDNTRVYIIDQKRRMILLVKGSDGKFQTPGGGVEDGELVRNAAVREIKEVLNGVLEDTSLKPLFFIKSRYAGRNSNVMHFLLDSTDLKLETFEQDTGGNIVDSEWVTLKSMGYFLNWGDKGYWLGEYLSQI
jgi:ADP-ribose pyrophosphatase YjhB (NUDIX family)